MKKLTKYKLLIYVMCCLAFKLSAQQIISSNQLKIQGRGFESSPKFHRVDTIKYNALPPNVKKLLTHSTGMYTTFRSDSKNIRIDWTTSDMKLSDNATAIMSRGFDMYVEESDGWHFAGVARPNLTNASSSYTIVEEMDENEKEFLLYFPLYKELIDFKLLLDEGATFTATEQQPKTKIIIYGSSIVHGASASRPGLAYPAQLSRILGAQVINLGVSGNAKMELSVARMINDVQDADLIILDCVPNSSPEQVSERTFAFVKELRKKHPKTPILMIESIQRQIGNYNLKWKSRLQEQNKNFNQEYHKLLASGETQLYYLPSDDLIGHDTEATVDGTHPTDVGFARMVHIIEATIREILTTFD